MPIDAEYYPNNKYGEQSPHFIFHKHIDSEKRTGYFFLVYGASVGGQKAAELISERLRLKLESQKIKDLISKSDHHSAVDLEESLRNELYRLVNLLNYALLGHKIQHKKTSDIAQAIVTLDLVIITHDWAFIVHIGHNGIISISERAPEIQTKPLSQYFTEVQILKDIDEDEKIPAIQNSSAKMNFPGSALGRDHIGKFTVDMVPLDKKKLFIIYTQRFNQSYKLEPGKISSEFLKISNEDSEAKTVAKNLYDASFNIEKDSEIGVLVVRCDASINDLRHQKIKYICKQLKDDNLDIFREVRDNPKHVYKLASLFDLVEIKNHVEFIKEGQPSSKFFILLSGAATVSHKDRALLTIARGDPIGDVSVMDSPVYLTQAKAVKDLQALVITKEHFFNLQRKDKDLFDRLLNGINRATRQKLVSALYTQSGDK